MKTAVEWLLEQLTMANFEEQKIAINKAKEMEKQQIVLAYETAMETDVYNTPLKIGLDYYNETFKDKL
jgi:hypothetical protein